MSDPTKPLADALRAMIDAMGGNPPDWLKQEVAQAEQALGQHDARMARLGAEVDVGGVAFPLRSESPEMFSAVVDRHGERVLYVDTGDAMADEHLTVRIIEAANASVAGLESQPRPPRPGR